MAITYTPLFTHEDWIDNVDRVQAGGPNGFNIRFNGISEEFGKLSTVVESISSAIANGPRLVNLPVENDELVQVPANGAAGPFKIDEYDRALLPPNIDRVYFATIFHRAGSTNIRHCILYRQESNRVTVNIQFFNHDAATTSQFFFRIMTFTL